MRFQWTYPGARYSMPSCSLLLIGGTEVLPQGNLVVVAFLGRE